MISRPTSPANSSNALRSMSPKTDWCCVSQTWFQGAKASGIPSLVRFARLKEKRLDGLVAHSRHCISTGRLEGFNNKIKVAKRVGYGYRNEEYFFTLVRYLSIPSVRGSSPKKT